MNPAPKSHLFCLIASASLFLAACPTAQSTTYTCNAVEKKALLGISSAASVSISAQDKTCVFSVDGVSATGKQSPEFVNAMNQVLSGPAGSSNLSPEMLAGLLLGPFTSDGLSSDISSSFRNSFGTAIRDVRDCVSNVLQSPSSSFGPGIQRENLVCRVLDGSPSGGGRNGFGEIEAQIGQPTLQVGVIFQRQTYTLFIPIRLIAAGLNGYRLGR